MTENKRRKIKEDDVFDIKKTVYKFLSNWKFFLISVILFCALGFLFTKLVSPSYHVSAKVLIEDNNSNGKGSSFLQSSGVQDFSSLFNVSNNVGNELEILQTRDLYEEVVREMNLNVTYFEKGPLRSTELYEKSPFWINFAPVSDSILPTTFYIDVSQLAQKKVMTISSDDLDTTFNNIHWGDTLHTSIGNINIVKTSLPIDDATYYFVLNPVDAVVDNIPLNLTAQIENTETSIITLTYNSSVPKKAEDVLKRLITDYMRRNVVERNRMSDSTLAFIDSRIALVGSDLNQIEAGVQNFKQKNNITDLSEQSKAVVSSAQEYYNKLNDVDVQLEIIKNTLDYLTTEKSRPIPSTLYNDPTFLSLVQKYNIALGERDKLLLATTEINPVVKNLDVQIENIRNDLITSLRNQQQAFEISRNKIVAENSNINTMVQNVPVQERRFLDLTREQSVKQALYLYLLQKKEETAIQKASNFPNASVIETPKSDYLPYFPNTRMVLAVSMILGLLFPSGILMLKQLLNNKITTKSDITEETDCTIIAEIGHSNKSSILSMKEDGRSLLAEQFRIFRTNLDFLIGQKKCPVILLTSSISGEGKSFIAANLSQVYGYSGKKVLMMEMDLRKPKVSGMYGLSPDNGFSNYVASGDSNIFRYIKTVPNSENVFLISAGTIPPNPAELLMSSSLENMFKELKNQFDLIIIDAPPIGAVADAQLLNKYVDINVFVIRQGYSYKASLEIINEISDTQKLSNLYIAVNDVKKGSSYKFSYGYGYGYSYGSYEHSKNRKSKKKKASFFSKSNN